MKRSSAVPGVLVASLAALFAVGCNNRSRDCVDSAGRVIPDQECVRSSGSHIYPHWVHRSGGGFFGSSRNTSAGSSVGTNGTTSRGGFGNSSGSSSFGG